MKCIAKCTRYMEDGNGDYDHEAKWITKDKAYYLISKDDELMQFIDDAGDVHYVPILETKKYFKIIGDEKYD